MKIAVISDAHIGTARSHKGVRLKLTEHSEALVREFVGTVNAQIRPDLVVQLGDLIEDSDPALDRENYTKGLGLLERLEAPVCHVVGNHDYANLSEDELRSLLGLDRLHYSFDIGDFHIAVLFSKTLSRKPGRIAVPPEQVDWLREDLAEARKPTVVFLHHSLADQDLTGNSWFEGLPEKCLVANRRQIRELLSASGKVIAVVNGHLHWNRLDVHDGIPYMTLQSLVENSGRDGLPSHAYGVLDLGGDHIRLEVRGRDPAIFDCSFRDLASLPPPSPEDGGA